MQERRAPDGRSGFPRPRTQNPAELAVLAQLEADGYSVLKRGWPDFLAVRGDEVRFIEVKPRAHSHLSPAQQRVAGVLAKLGIEVELLTP